MIKIAYRDVDEKSLNPMLRRFEEAGMEFTPKEQLHFPSLNLEKNKDGAYPVPVSGGLVPRKTREQLRVVGQAQEDLIIVGTKNLTADEICQHLMHETQKAKAVVLFSDESSLWYLNFAKSAGIHTITELDQLFDEGPFLKLLEKHQKANNKFA